MESYGMKEVCSAVGISYETLKFYCNQGLVPNVKRDEKNRRRFDARDVEWLRSLMCLKKCGLGIEDMRMYMELCLQGKRSIPQRREMLAQRRNQLLDRMRELEQRVAYIDGKQQFYNDVEAGRIAYVSNLLPKGEGV